MGFNSGFKGLKLLLYSHVSCFYLKLRATGHDGARSQDWYRSASNTLPVDRYIYPEADTRSWSAATDKCCCRNFLVPSLSHTAIGKFMLRGKGTSPTAWQHRYSYAVQPATSSHSHKATSAVVQLLGHVEICFELSLLWRCCINVISSGQVCTRQPSNNATSAGGRCRWMLYDLASGFRVCFWRWLIAQLAQIVAKS